MWLYAIYGIAAQGADGSSNLCVGTTVCSSQGLQYSKERPFAPLGMQHGRCSAKYLHGDAAR
jgi:hypothetical protein